MTDESDCLPNNETTHELARNMRYPFRDADRVHTDDEARVGDTRLDMSYSPSEEKPYTLTRMEYGGVRIENPEDRDDDVDNSRITLDWHRDEEFSMTENEFEMLENLVRRI